MNTAHNGVHLGRALYKIVRRVGVEKKVGTLSCMAPVFIHGLHRLDG